MNSLLTKRLPGILAAGLVALAVAAAGAPAAAASADSSAGATTSALTNSQKKAKKKALRKCNKKSTAKKRKRCKNQVNKKYKKISQNNPAPIGKTWNVDVGDNYYAPSSLSLKVNDAIKWNWSKVGGFEVHNVTLLDPLPAGVARTDFVSQTTAIPSYTFKRQFTKPGAYNFICSFHFGMTMKVNVAK